MNHFFAAVTAMSIMCLGCIPEPPDVEGGGGGGSGSVGSSTSSSSSSGDVFDPCEPGGMYTCGCSNGNGGNRFCSWTGDSFTECMLCGKGSEPRESTGIPCNVNPKPGEMYKACPETGTCKPLTCWDKECVYAPAIPTVMLDDEVVGDCKRLMCDGFGNAVEIPYPDDCDGTCDSNGVCQP